jgi:hypothetical protein
MKIKISTASPDALSHDTLILGFFSDERPPKGYCGLVDWRLNGMISTAIARGRISGDFLEKLLYAFPKRVRVERLLLFGLGPIAELTFDRLYNGGYEMARTASGIRTDDLAIPIPAEGRGPLNLSGMAEALVTGLYDGFAGDPGGLAQLSLEIPAKPGNTGEIRAGLDRFLAAIGSAACDIIKPEDPPRAASPGPREAALNSGGTC